MSFWFGPLLTYVVIVLILHYIFIEEYVSCKRWKVYFNITRRQFIWWTWLWPVSWSWEIVKWAGSWFEGWWEGLVYFYGGGGNAKTR